MINGEGKLRVGQALGPRGSTYRDLNEHQEAGVECNTRALSVNARERWYASLGK